MQKQPILMLAPNRDDIVARYRDEFDFIQVPPGADPILPPGSDVRAAISFGSIPFPDPLLDASPNMGLLCLLGAGYDRIDIGAMAERGIVVANAAGMNALAVAEVAVGHLICLLRRIPQADRFMRAGEWARLPEPRWWARGVEGRKVGIYGLGSIGLGVARSLAALGAQIGYCSRSPKPEVDYPRLTDIRALAEWADDLIVATDLNASTEHSIDSAVLTALGPQGFVVNVARGGVIDEAALLAALRSGTIAGAGLDVFSGEPAFGPAFATLENVLLTPHMGGMTVQSSLATDEFVMANVRAFFSGRPLRSVVKPS